MARNVIAFINQPTPQYVSVKNVQFAPAPPLTPGMYQVPNYGAGMPIPNRIFSKDFGIPYMNIQSIYNYERAGKVGF